MEYRGDAVKKQKPTHQTNRLIVRIAIAIIIQYIFVCALACAAHFVVLLISFPVLCYFISTAIQNENEKKQKQNGGKVKMTTKRIRFHDFCANLNIVILARQTKTKTGEKNLIYDMKWNSLFYTDRERTANAIPWDAWHEIKEKVSAHAHAMITTNSEM